MFSRQAAKEFEYNDIISWDNIQNIFAFFASLREYKALSIIKRPVSVNQNLAVTVISSINNFK